MKLSFASFPSSTPFTILSPAPPLFPLVLDHPHFLCPSSDVLRRRLTQLSPFPSAGFRGLSRSNLKAVASLELLGGHVQICSLSFSFLFWSGEMRGDWRYGRIVWKLYYLVSLQKPEWGVLQSTSCSLMRSSDLLTEIAKKVVRFLFRMCFRVELLFGN